MIKFSYGADSNFSDVTTKASAEFLHDNQLKILRNANFNDLFGDPVPNKVKNLVAVFDDKTTITFPEQRNKTYTISLLKSFPKTIVQYWSANNGEPMPNWAINNAEVIKFHHRDFEYKIFDHAQALDFIRQNFSASVVTAFCKCAIPAMQSDLFRYCYLYVMGGFYFDLKTQCSRRFLHSYVDRQEEMLLLTRKHEFLFNGFIGSQPRSLGLCKTIAECVENILNEKMPELYLTTGTPVLTKECKAAYGVGYERASVLNYEDNCPITFSGDKYNNDHWSVAEKKQSIYVRIDLKVLLNVDNIFVLNLDSRTDRLEQCVAEFAKFGPNQTWERFPALRGANVDVQQQYAQAYTEFSNALSQHEKKYVDGAFGCLVSHFEMIKLAQQRGYKRILILEDDFEATDLLFDCNLLQRIGRAPFHMFYLSASQIVEPTQTQIVGIKRVQRALSTGAYIIDQSAYSAVLDNCLNFKKQIDVFFADFIQKKYDVLCTVRCAVVQRESFSDIVQQNIKYRFE